MGESCGEEVEALGDGVAGGGVWGWRGGAAGGWVGRGGGWRCAGGGVWGGVGWVREREGWGGLRGVSVVEWCARFPRQDRTRVYGFISCLFDRWRHGNFGQRQIGDISKSADGARSVLDRRKIGVECGAP